MFVKRETLLKKMAQKELIQKLPFDYIRGLIDGEGCFSFSTNTREQRKVPSFALRMHSRDKNLVEMVRDTLGLKNRIYEYHYPHNYPGKGIKFNRGPQVILIVRELGSLKNVIVPFFYKRLYGHKGKQFEEWMEKIGSDPYVSESYKFIYKIYKDGFYDRNPKYLE